MPICLLACLQRRGVLKQGQTLNRVTFTEVTQKAVREALQHPRQVRVRECFTICCKQASHILNLQAVCLCGRGFVIQAAAAAMCRHMPLLCCLCYTTSAWLALLYPLLLYPLLL